MTQARTKRKPKREAAAQAPASTRPRLLERYRSEVAPTLARDFGYGNSMEVPRLGKVVLNIGLGEALTNPRAMEAATKDLTEIAGQRPMVTRSRKSIAGFKLREGQAIGLMVTLRGARMYHFLDKLFNAALPRLRDFRGVSRTAFDGRGNYTLGIREQVVFPEIDYNQIDKIRSFQANIITTAPSGPGGAATTGAHGYALRSRSNARGLGYSD